MQKSSLVLLLLLFCSILSAVLPAVDATYSYQKDWATNDNQILINFEYTAPAGYTATNVEINRTGYASSQMEEYSQWFAYYDADFVVGNSYTYTSRVHLVQDGTGNPETTDWHTLLVDTSEIEDLLNPVTNIQIGSGVSWDGVSKTVVLSWDYTIPTGYWLEGFAVKRADQDMYQEVYGMELPYMYEDSDIVIGNTYSYFIKAKIMDEMGQWQLVTLPSANVLVDTNNLPLSNITHNGWLPGSYNDISPIELNSSDVGASIYYTLNGE